MVIQAFKAEAGRSLSSKLAYSTEQVPGQPKLEISTVPTPANLPLLLRPRRMGENNLS